ncbi:MAG: type I-D CRISPR-associated protein Cas10d/Csc3 [bacterium]|nr:type I-D CRISPR-associated protein Cas10d/Csc3 [bacterium]
MSDEYSRSFQQHVLLEAVDKEDVVLQNYVRQVVPNIINRLGTMSAKGGKAFLEKCQQAGYNYQDKPDQSMVAHILNGIFPVRRIMREIEQRGLRQLTEIEQKLYFCAYTLHDADKLAGEKDLYDIGSEEGRDNLTQKLDLWIEALGIKEFFPECHEYRDDLIYLILNTQEKYGVDVLPYNYGELRISARRRDVIRDFCNLSDVLSYLDQHGEGTMFTSPANLCQGKPDKPRKLLAGLSNGQLRFAYHQLSEVTGLLSNFINNAVMHLIEGQGGISLLFFPHGVVYLTTPSIDCIQVAEHAYDAVLEKIGTTCKREVQSSLTGYTRAGKGLKFADYYYQIFSLKELLGVSITAVNKIIHENKKAVSPARLEAMLTMQKNGGKWRIPEHIDLQFEPAVEVDRLAEYLTVVEGIVERVSDISDSATVIFEALGLSQYCEDAGSIPDKGGAKYRWYFIAGKYLQQHPGLDNQELTEVMRSAAQAVVDRFRTQIERYDAQQERFVVLKSYVASVLDINGSSALETRDFARELQIYASAKKSGRGKELACSLCSTPYATDRQQETAIPFQPQVYSNKQSLNKQADRRGICEVCSLELMLRQILMKSRYQVTGSKFENQKVKYLYIYPGYYFTTETAKYTAQLYRDSLKRFNFFDVRRSLAEKQELQVSDILALRDFQLDVDDAGEEKISPFMKMDLPENDLATLLFFGIPALDRDPTDTNSWIAPAFLALALPFVFSAKIVASEFPLPLYSSGNEFKETVILDAPHHFLSHLLGNDRFRIDEVFPMLRLLTSVYGMHLDVYSSGGKPNWNQINEIAANLDTDTMYVFHYLMKFQRKQSWDGFPPTVVKRYLTLYDVLQQTRKEEKMGMFQELVDRYYTFYHPDGFNSHSIVRPISQVITAVLNADKELPEEDLILEVIGALKGVQDRVHTRQAKGFAPIGGYDEISAIRKFVEYFYQDIFLKYCRGERALLRERANRIKYGCEAYYLETYAPRKKGTNKSE